MNNTLQSVKNINSEENSNQLAHCIVDKCFAFMMRNKSLSNQEEIIIDYQFKNRKQKKVVFPVDQEILVIFDNPLIQEEE